MSDLPRLLGGRYEVGDLIGRGGMAEVHVGHDNRLGRQVAIKMLRSDLARDASFLTRFRREAQSSAGLNHASIVAVYDSGEDHTVDATGQPQDVPFIVMEYVEGKTLREVLTRRGHLSPADSCRITEGILDALAYSHRMGIVHRDIKPANVMIGTDGSVKVMDFGIARAIADSNATMTQTQAVIGTAQYLSPEQAQGQTVDARSDLYSTGCLLYELLTGRTPFQGDTPVAIAYQHVGQEPPAPSTFEPAVPADLDAVVLHSLAKDRTARYQNAADFRADLQAVRLGRPISAVAAATLAGLGGAAGSLAGGAAATERISPLAAPPTEVYAVTTRSGGGAPSPAARPAPGSGDVGGTTTLPAVPPAKPPRRRGMWAWLTAAALVALVLLGWGVKAYVDHQANAASMVAVPDVTGQPRSTAQLKITQAGLVPVVTTENNKEVAADSVIRQDPQGATQVKKGSTVQLVVSAGPEAIVVPDLKGRTQAEAKAELERQGLTLGTVTEQNDTKQPKGTVVSSSPPAGQSVAPKGAVNLTVSSGKVTVPDLKGMSQNDAYNQLASTGLTPKSVFKQTSEAPDGTVIAQDQKPGAVLDSGATLTITVAQAAPPSPSPTPTSSGSPSPTPSSSH